MSTTTTRNDHLPAITSTLAVAARMNELGISKSQLSCFRCNKSADRMMEGMMVTVETAKAVCNQLDAGYHELFTTVQSKNHQTYSLPKTVDDGEGYDGYNDTDTDKSTDKQHTKRPREIRPAQSICEICGSLSSNHTILHGATMCLRCANIPRCADCLRAAYTLYVVAGDMVCPQCESGRKNRQMESQMEAVK